MLSDLFPTHMLKHLSSIATYMNKKCSTHLGRHIVSFREELPFFSIMLIKVKEELESFLYLVQIILNIWSILTLWIRALVTFLICVLDFRSVEIMTKWFRLLNLALDQIVSWVKLEGFYNTATPRNLNLKCD